MSTSPNSASVPDRGEHPAHYQATRLRGIAAEAMVAAAIVTTLSLILSPTDPGLAGMSPHLMWIAVLVLAARYGMRGLVSSLAASAVGLAGASLAVHAGLGWMATRAQSGTEIMMFVGAVAVAWVAGSHERRKAELAASAAEQALIAAEAQAGFAELREVASALGQRADRAEVSISFLRSLAARLESSDPAEGAQAALELALGRLGARAGVVLMHDGARLRAYAHHGQWSASSLTPPDVFTDRTAQRAFDQLRAVSGSEVDQIGELDSDLAAPILAEDGSPIGVIALRGVGFEVLVPSAMRELAAIARWAARPLGGVAPEVAPEGATTYSIHRPDNARAAEPARRTDDARRRPARGTTTPIDVVTSSAVASSVVASN